MKLKIGSDLVIPVFIVFVTLSLLAVWFYFEWNRAQITEVYIFSLKSGQAMYIRTFDDRRYIVNGGSNSEIIRHISKVQPFYSRRIDGLFATDLKDKNISGLIDIVNRYSVGKVYLPNTNLNNLKYLSSTDKAFATFEESLNERKVTINSISYGDEISLSQSAENKLSFRVLFPVSSEKFEYSKSSLPELAFNLSYKNKDIFYIGSVSPKIQKMIIADYFNSLVPNEKNGKNTDRVLITSSSASFSSLSMDTITQLRPKYLIYSRQKQSGSSKAKNPDPLALFSIQERFNLKETGDIRLTFYEDRVEIIRI